MKNLKEEIGKIINRRGISWGELAESVGMTRNGLNKALQKRTLKHDAISILTKKLSVPYEFFTEEYSPSVVNEGPENYAGNVGRDNYQNIGYGDCISRLKAAEDTILLLKQQVKDKDQIIELLRKK